MRVGLVLGGGGRVGLAYHAGALAALEHDLGWDPRSADVIVGTSAGAVVGALLRRGVPASDLAAMSVGATTRATPTPISAAAREPLDLPVPRLRSFLRLPRLPSVDLLAPALRRPWRIDLVSAIVAVLADGDVDLAQFAAQNAAALGPAWPEQPLWICAVRQHDQRRIVFGRDVVPPLPTAVMASCSIPGYFRPVAYGGRRFVDGGVRSPTNVDVLKREQLDLVIVVSPMSGRELPALGLVAAIRRYAKRKVERETRVLGARGCPVVLLEPGRQTARVAGIDLMRDDNSIEVVQAAFLDAGQQLRGAEHRRLLEPLGSRRAPGEDAVGAP